MTGHRPASPKAKSRLPLGIAAAGLVVAALAGTWLLLRGSDEPPDARLRTALDLIDRPDDPAAWESGRQAAEAVRESGYRNPEFPGAAEFVLGVAAARSVNPEVEPEKELAHVVELLEASERQGLDEARRPEWSFLLGTSLFALKRYEAARPYLEEAWWTYPTRGAKVDAGLALAEIDFVRPAADPVVSVDLVLDELGPRRDLSEGEARRLAVVRTRAALRAQDYEQAGQALVEIESAGRGDPEVELLRAEILLAAERLDEARKLLTDLTKAEAAGVGGSRLATAFYLLGRCEQRRGEAGAAGRAFERAADLAPDSADGVRGALAAARVLQQSGRDEEASALFRQAVSAQTAGESRPLPDDEVRREIRAGWDVWAAQGEQKVPGAIDRAVALATAAEAVVGPVESRRLQARGRELSAEAAENEWRSGDEAARAAGERARNDRWRESGEAYRELAGVVTDSAAIGEALWTSADHFSRGRAFEEADAVLTELLELKLPRLEAAVLARRGRVRLDLGRADAAAEDFLAVLDRHPTDPESFESRLLLGRCHQERGETEKAEAVWRELLALSVLTPDASEWRRGLFDLAELLHRRGVAGLARSAREGGSEAGEGAAVASLDEAIARFGEFILRSPDADSAVEARALRADAMRRRAEVSLDRAAAAETESLRDVHRKESERLLAGAIGELRAVQAALAPLDDARKLPRVGRELLKSTAFDLGHAYADLGRHQEAVVAYGAAVNRYPDDARVLPAYLRMAEAYRRLGRADDARAAVEQARLVLAQMPTGALTTGSGLGRADWEDWLERARGGGPPSPGP